MVGGGVIREDLQTGQQLTVMSELKNFYKSSVKLTQACYCRDNILVEDIWKQGKKQFELPLKVMLSRCF